MNIKHTLTAAALAAVTATANAGEPVPLDTETARINYSLGYQIGGDFKRQSVEIDPQAIVRGIQDALSGATPAIPRDQMHTLLVDLKRQVVETEKTRIRDLKARYVAEGKAFMEENAAKAGVMTTETGLQYRIVEEGTGKTPTADDRVTVNYRGRNLAGVEFDSSYKRGEPATFPLKGVIRGWSEGLQKVREGGKIELVIPPKLAYDRKGPLAGQTLIFEVELLAIAPPEQASGDGAQGTTNQ